MMAGDLRDRVAFDRPLGTLTDTGGQVTTWQEAISALWAGIKYLRGSDTVVAARLTGRQPAVVTMRASAITRTIKPEWRMRDLRTGNVFAIRAIHETPDRAFMEILVEGGAER